MVALVYGLGRRMGGRPVGLASGLALSSIGLLRGRDAPGRQRRARWPSSPRWRSTPPGGAPDDEGPSRRTDADGDPAGTWRLVFFAALGLGFLSKGPIVLMLTSVAIVPYLVQTGRPGIGPAPAPRRAGIAALRGDGGELAGGRLLARPQRRASG